MRQKYTNIANCVWFGRLIITPCTQCGKVTLCIFLRAGPLNFWSSQLQSAQFCVELPIMCACIIRLSVQQLSSCFHAFNHSVPFPTSFVFLSIIFLSIIITLRIGYISQEVTLERLLSTSTPIPKLINTLQHMVSYSINC